MYPRRTLSHFTHDVNVREKLENEERMLADDIGGRDVSESNARRDSRNSKHEFLHYLFPFG